MLPNRHGTLRQHPIGTEDGNVRHYCLINTLGGVFFRILAAGELMVGDTLELVERPHPAWNLQRLGSLLYSQAGVLPGGGSDAASGEKW